MNTLSTTPRWVFAQDEIKPSSSLAPIAVLGLGAVRHIHNPASARSALGLSQSQLGSKLGKTVRGRALHWTTISHYERGNIIPPASLHAYIGLIEEALQAAFPEKGWRVARLGQTWRFVVIRNCVVCNDAFEVKRANATKCPHCRH